MSGKEDPRVTDKYVFFWGGWLSQWHKSTFWEGEYQYNTAEQYMMAGKARLFKDEKTLEEILKCSDPRKQKSLGRKVKNFDQKTWDDNCQEIVYQANLLKFQQSKELKERLLATGSRILVEASPYDDIWGIGMAANDPDILDPSKWRGQNLLGKAIMRARETIRKEEEEGKAEGKKKPAAVRSRAALGGPL